MIFLAKILLLSSLVFSHGGDDGPTVLESEFSKLSHLHLPFNFSMGHGIEFGYRGVFGSENHHHEGNEDIQEDSHAEEQESAGANFHPVLFGGYDNLKRFISLEESKGGGLERAPDQGKFVLLENKKWGLGLGVESDFYLPIPLTTAGFGVSFLKGKNYISLRYFASKQEKRKKLALPLSPSTLARSKNRANKLIQALSIWFGRILLKPIKLHTPIL